MAVHGLTSTASMVTDHWSMGEGVAFLKRKCGVVWSCVAGSFGDTRGEETLEASTTLVLR